MPRRSRDNRRGRSPSSSADSSESLTPDAHTDYQHEEFVDKVAETRNSVRWSNRRTSLSMGSKKGSNQKSARRVNKETAKEEQTLRERRKREEEYARRKKDREEKERRNRDRERYNREQDRERDRTHESTHSGRSDQYNNHHAPIENDINNADFKLLRQHSAPELVDEDYADDADYGRGTGGAAMRNDVESKVKKFLL